MSATASKRRWGSRTATWGIAALLVGAGVSAQEVNVEVSANRDQIYLGESVVLTVKVAGDDRAEPDLSALTNATIRSLGSQSQSHYSIVIVNGRVKKEGFSGRIYSYEVTPRQAGPFTAGPVHVRVAGRTFSASGPTIQVMGIEEQTRVLISVTASHESVLVDEPFEVTLSIAVERLKGRFAEIDPLDPDDPPLLTVPFLEPQPIAGLEGPDIQATIRRHLVERADAPGFYLNNYTVRDDPFRNLFNFDFDAFMRERRARFMFDRRVLEKDGKSYFEYTLTLRYTPREEGTYTFGPVVFKGKALLGLDATGGVGKHVFAVGPACTVRVVPPPEEGRPATFIGAIGTNLVVRARLDATTCNVGDPLTLTLEISGAISLDNVYPLALSQQPELLRDFRVYDDTVRMNKKEGAREFAYVIRPIHSGTLEVPPIEVAYFDSAERRYRVVKSEPIPLRVNPAALLDKEMVIATATGRSVAVVQARDAAKQVIAPVTVDSAGAEPVDPLETRCTAVIAGTGPLAYALVMAFGWIRRALAVRAGSARKRKALARARKGLVAARRLAATDLRAARHAVFDALREYAGAQCDMPASALAPSDVRRLLEEHGYDESLARRVGELLERNFNAVYAVETGTAEEVLADCEAAEQILEAMEAGRQRTAARSQTSERETT